MAFLLGECLLLQRLEEANMSQAEFARRMGVTRQFVNMLTRRDRATRAVMSLEFATNAAIVLGCKISGFYILERKPQPIK